MTTLLVVGNDRIGARALRMLDLRDSDVVIAVDRSGGIGRVLRLVLRRRIDTFDLLCMALAEVRRPPRGALQPGAVSFTNNDELCDLMGSVSPDRVVLFRAGFAVSRKVLDIGVPILNIHCARVPENGGLNSVLRALRDGALDQAATMHRVEEKIDAGEVMDTESFSLEPRRSYFRNEEAAYEAGTRLLARALGAPLRDDEGPVSAKVCRMDDGGPASSMVRRWLGPALLAVVSTAFTTWREVQGLAGRLTLTLSPAELIGFRNNPFLETTGFPSGSEITAVSLPLQLYRLLDWMGIGTLDSARVMVAVEALVFFVLVAMAVHVALPRVTPTLASAAATVATVGYALSLSNLANWGFLWGWNYGFAYAFAALALAYGLRRGWTRAVIVLALLLTVHSLVAVLVGLTLAPLFLVDVMRRRVGLSWRAVVLSGALSITFLMVQGGTASLSSGALDTEAYVARLKAFQSHLFYRFDFGFLTRFSPGIGLWFVMVVVLLAASQVLKERAEADLAHRLLAVVATITSLSVAGWFHSGLDAPNTDLLLLALHRSSLFVVLLVFIVAVPLMMQDMRSARRLPLMLPMLVLLLLPETVDRSVLGLLVLVALLGWIAASARGDRDERTTVVVSPTVVAVWGALWFLFDGFRYVPGLRQLPGYVTGDGGMVAFLLLLVLLGVGSLVVPEVMERRLVPVATRTLLIAATVFLFTGAQILENPHKATGEYRERISDYVAVQQWVRGNTPTDAVFLLPVDDWGFGWRVFSERASVGKPREWLHYSFLYSRDQDTMAEGTRRANLLGIDVDAWFEQRPVLGWGDILVGEMTDRFNAMTDEQIVRLGADLGADHFVFEPGRDRGTGCFTTLHENSHFTVAVAEPRCGQAEG